MLTPASIERKQFATTRFREGYDQTEVDEFLDRVGSDYKWHHERVAVLEAELAAARKPVNLPPGQPSMESVERMLVVAQQTVDKQEADAYAEAGRIKAEAQQQADQMLTDAQARAEEIVSEAHTERLNQIASLEARESQLTSAVEGLEARADEARAWVEQALKTFDRRSAKEAGNG